MLMPGGKPGWGGGGGSTVELTDALYIRHFSWHSAPDVMYHDEVKYSRFLSISFYYGQDDNNILNITGIISHRNM